MENLDDSAPLAKANQSLGASLPERSVIFNSCGLIIYITCEMYRGARSKRKRINQGIKHL